MNKNQLSELLLRDEPSYSKILEERSETVEALSLLLVRSEVSRIRDGAGYLLGVVSSDETKLEELMSDPLSPDLRLAIAGGLAQNSTLHENVIFRLLRDDDEAVVRFAIRAAGAHDRLDRSSSIALEITRITNALNQSEDILREIQGVVLGR